MPAELQKDLALASADADLQLALLSTDQTAIVGAVERTTPPARAVARSTRAQRPRRSPTPQVVADVQPENEIVEEPEVAAEEPMPPSEVAATTRPRAIEPVYGGSGTGSRGTDWGTIIGIAGTVVLRGGDVGEDRCIPPGAGRGRTPIAINERFPPRTRGTGRVTMGDRSGRMGGSRPVVRSAPSRPRDVATRPTSSSSRTRPMPSGNVREGRAAASGDLQ
ncbi:MAG TPA: hypothetical protein VMM77_02600 [Gemmatimonadaceae bacterium]|nr:hypothetical protein [Gemmatimonadaceae bacterium]